MPDTTLVQEPPGAMEVVDAFEDHARSLAAALRTFYGSYGLERLSALKTSVESLTHVVALLEHLHPMITANLDAAASSSNQTARDTARLLRSRLSLVRGARLFGELRQIWSRVGLGEVDP